MLLIDAVSGAGVGASEGHAGDSGADIRESDSAPSHYISLGHLVDATFVLSSQVSTSSTEERVLVAEQK